MRTRARRKRNPTDATLRNVRAASKRIDALERGLAELKQRVDQCPGCSQRQSNVK